MPLNEREVADFLLANPQFFEQHAELLASIKLMSPLGNRAVSLQERQIERRLAELLRYGHENDSIAARFTRWTSRVLAERDPHALPATVTRGLLEIFEVPQAALRLWDVAENYAMAEFSRYVGEEVRIFANSLATPYCGANTGFEAAQWLTAQESRGVVMADGAEGAVAASQDATTTASIALVALRDPHGEGGANAFGLLVMGSPDVRRFHEGMGTDFLSQIGSLASAALSRLLAH